MDKQSASLWNFSIKKEFAKSLQKKKSDKDEESEWFLKTSKQKSPIAKWQWSNVFTILKENNG